MPKFTKRPSTGPEKVQGGTSGNEMVWDALRRLAETLGNVSEACRRSGISRHKYYEWKVDSGREGEAERLGETGIRRKHPHSIAVDLEQEVLKLSLDYPEWGCDRISYYLKLHGMKVSSPTVQKILIRNRMGKLFQRLKEKGRST